MYVRTAYGSWRIVTVQALSGSNGTYTALTGCSWTGIAFHAFHSLGVFFVVWSYFVTAYAVSER